MLFYFVSIAWGSVHCGVFFLFLVRKGVLCPPRPTEEVVGEQGKTPRGGVFPPRSPTKQGVEGAIWDCDAQRLCDWGGQLKSHPRNQIRNSRVIQSYRPTVFFLSLKIERKSLICKGFFSFVVHFCICGAYMLCLGSLKMQKSTTPRQVVVPSYR